MLLISINYNNPPGYLLTFLLTGLGLVSLFHTHRGLSGLMVSHGPSAPVFAGGQAEFPVILGNPDRWPRHAIATAWSRTGAESLKDIPAGAEVTVPLFLPAENRGELHPKRIAVSTVFPLGLFRAWSWVGLPLHCMVYPAPAPSMLPAASQSATGDTDHIRPQGADDDFHGLRTYRPGDPLRHVAWKAVARGRELVSKEYAGTQGTQEIVLNWDDLAEKDVEARLSRLCRLILDAEADGTIYSLNMPGRRIEPGSGPHQMHACLTVLALFPDSRKETT